MNGLVLIIILIIIIIWYINRNKSSKYADTLRFESDNNDSCDKITSVVLDSGKPGICLGIIAGVHGNEPAGSYTLIKMLRAGELTPTTGKIILIPRANVCGLRDNNRYAHGGMFGGSKDLNRMFDENGGTDEMSKQIIETFKPCNMVIDFHEGWGWYSEKNGSIGSTITPTSVESARLLSYEIGAILNQDISKLDKWFSVRLGESCDINSTLGCYMQKNKRPYILIETSGQDDIQPMDVRYNQVRRVVQTVLGSLRMATPLPSATAFDP